MHVVAGSAFGATSPVADLVADARGGARARRRDRRGRTLELPAAAERALYAVDHPIEVDGVEYPEFTMVVLEPGTSPTLVAPRGGRVVLVGGEPLGHRFLSWNFVASTRERIRAAEGDWQAQRFAKVPGETEFIPLPEHPAAEPPPGAPPG